LDQDFSIEAEMRDKSRLEMFVDGVFAIAITILVLELHVPALQNTNIAVIHYLAEIIPELFGYVLSFFLLAIFLNSHHRQFRFIEQTNANFWWLNIILLLFITTIPFSTSLLTGFGGIFSAVIFFNLNVFFAGVIIFSMWKYAEKSELIKKDTGPDTIRFIERRNLAIPLIAFIAILTAFISPGLSNLCYLLLLVIIPTINRFKL
jgi:uncharacterized membrane protein